MKKSNIDELIEELHRIGKHLHSTRDNAGPLMSLEEAAHYTSRSASLFRRELKLGMWTCIQVGGKGHPKFSPKDLDEDIKVWAKHSKYRRPVKPRK